LSKILIVARTEKSIEELSALLTENNYSEDDILAVTGNADALKLLSKKNIDNENLELVIMNVTPGEIYQSNLALAAAQNTTAAIVLLLPEKQYEGMRSEAEGFGILTIKNPIEKIEFENIIKAAKIYINRLRMFKSKSERLDAKVAEYKIVNRAKWALIENLHFTEEQAHKYIEKQAMDLRTSRKEIANNILKTYYIKSRGGN